jgi:hypothetical protein
MPFASSTTDAFRRQFAAASPGVQSRIRTAYRLWAENPDHPSLRFQKVHDTLPIYSVRVGLNWRAVGVMKGDHRDWVLHGLARGHCAPSQFAGVVVRSIFIRDGFEP